MTRILTFAGASLLVVALAAPVEAGQAGARSRGGDSGSGSSSGSSSSGSASSGGGGGSEAPVARRAPSTSQPRSSGGAQPRSGSVRGGSTAGAASQRGSSAGGSQAAQSGSGARLAQSRGARAAATYRGQAMARPYVPVRPNRPVFVGRYYSPWYFGGSVYSSRYYGYNPFGWRYSPYGYYGLYGFVPYGSYYYDPWDPFMYGYGGAAGGSFYYRDRDEDNVRATGSLRLRMNPKHAKVYVDGALVGTVDEFDGLRDHLEIDAGPHQLEIRADGYENYRTDVVVSPGKTTTERAKLKKK